MKVLLKLLSILLVVSSCGTTSKIESIQQQLSTIETENQQLRESVITLSEVVTMLERKVKLSDVLSRQLNDLQEEINILKATSYKEPDKGSQTSNNSDGITRCQATTLKGTQCKRMAAPGSKYCWQHQN